MNTTKALSLLLFLGLGFLPGCGLDMPGAGGATLDAIQPSGAVPQTLRQAPLLCSAPDDPLCHDLNPCTADSCVEGQCVQTLIVGCCRNDLDCGDGNPCSKDQCDCPWGLNPGGACVCPEGEPDCTRACTWDPIEACCWNDLQCEDDNPCNLEACVNHVCRYAPNWDHKNCCQNDANCDDGNPCTEAYCDQQTLSCVEWLVPDQIPKCCFVDVECDDEDRFTWDVCKDHRCINTPPIAVCCGETEACNDYNPCTKDACDCGLDRCTHVNIPGCCKSDDDCAQPPLTDGQICTADRCNIYTNRCVFTPVEDCCFTSAECDDGNPCSTDACVVNTCRRVWQEGCCVSDDDCQDGNSCSIDTCQRAQPSDPSGTCGVEVSPSPDCCTNALECDDGNILTIDMCVDYMCDPSPDYRFDCMDEHDCSDDDFCTCDLCTYGGCRHLPPAFSDAGCNVHPLCCHFSEQCADDGDPCTKEICDNSLCRSVPDHLCVPDTTDIVAETVSEVVIWDGDSAGPDTLDIAQDLTNPDTLDTAQDTARPDTLDIAQDLVSTDTAEVTKDLAAPDAPNTDQVNPTDLPQAKDTQDADTATERPSKKASSGCNSGGGGGGAGGLLLALALAILGVWRRYGHKTLG